MLSKNRIIFAISALIISAEVNSAALCGPYKFTVDDAGKGSINGEKVTSQRATFLAQEGDWNNIKLDMTLMPARDGFMYGFEFVKRNGKAFLNVELIRANVDAPRLIGSFDCHKVAG
ncbi:TPA: hypothetical protein ACGUIF_004838 [Serratia liquefaciens]